jgi:hypothetical protein
VSEKNKKKMFFSALIYLDKPDLQWHQGSMFRLAGFKLKTITLRHIYEYGLPD